MALYKNDKKKNDLKEIWAKRIDGLLKENDMTQASLAKSIKLSEGAISGLMAGAQPRIPTLKAIADVFNVSLDYLVGLTESRKTDNIYKDCREAFGLKDGALDFLAQLKEGKKVYEYDVESALSPVSTLRLINFVIENISFWKDIEPLLLEYSRVKAVEERGVKPHVKRGNKSIHLTEPYKYDTSLIKFFLNDKFMKIVDDYDKLNRLEESNNLPNNDN